jgi:hypothetical protein
VTRAVLAVAVVVAGAVAAALLLPRGGARAPAAPRVYATVPVVRGTVSKQSVVTGTLEFARRRTLQAGFAGVVTALPAVGARIGFGQPLYSVDATPVLLMRGRVPMWRDFQPGMANGPDVRQLEAGLADMGYFFGWVDDAFTAETSAAIVRLHRALGVPCESAEPDRRRRAIAQRKCLRSLPRGAVVFGSSGVRVAARKATIGAQLTPGSPVLGVSSAEKIVRADVKLADQDLVDRGTTVKVVLPDGVTTNGKVASVGPATEQRQEGSNSTAVVIGTTIRLRSQARVKAFQLASVTVQFASARRSNVLSVPTEALVALNDTAFAVEVPAATGTTRLRVKTGLFAAGRVEISGPGLHAGLRVVVPGQ